MSQHYLLEAEPRYIHPSDLARVDYDQASAYYFPGSYELAQSRAALEAPAASPFVP